MELLSLEINAVDYVEENRKDELERALKDISGRSESPKWLSQWGFPGPFFNTQDWGNIKVENLSEFEEVRIHVLLPRELPFIHIVLLQGRISKSVLEGISKGEIKNQEVRKKFETWKRPIFDKINGLASINKNQKQYYNFGASKYHHCLVQIQGY